ncbi:MAG TPA: hypothetical protein VIE89_33065 [Candidatus Binatia bacterium]|jgi:hypothetical protein
MASEVIKFTFNQPTLFSFEPDILAPHQYLKNYRSTHRVESEKALMLAVLAEAVDTYQKYAFSESSRGRTLFREADAWFWREEADSVFSFPVICEVFGLDPGFLRSGLMQWTASRRGNALPRKKFQLHLERGRARKPLNTIGKKAVSAPNPAHRDRRWAYPVSDVATRLGEGNH